MLIPIDIHTHLSAPIVGDIQVINGTSPEDWTQIAHLARQDPDRTIPAFGLHPWFLKELPDDWSTTLEAYLNEFPRALLGEIGLDKTREADSPFPLQEEVFLAQWNLALRLNRPAVLHCVKAWHRLLPLLKTPRLPFLCHAFNGSSAILSDLLEKNAYFSLGPRELLSSRSKELLPLIPQNKYMIESDGRPLEELLYAVEQACLRIDRPVETFLAQSMANAKDFLEFSR